MEGYELSVSFDERNDQSISYSYDNYDSYNKNSWDVSDANGLIPYGEHDEQGRLLKNVSEIVDYDTLPEDLDVFISKWQPQQLCSSKDWEWTSRYTWPDVDGVVTLKRLDLFQTETPQSQQATGDIEESRRIRNTPGWYPVRSLFLLNIPTQWTKLIHIESTGPPRRHRFRPHDKNNQRDFSKWLLKEVVNGFIGSDRMPGVSDFYVDYRDMPDRYFLNTGIDAPLGLRRLYRFGAYSATQYYILEKEIFHEALDAEGGTGFTYLVQPGPIIFAKKNWRVIGSFYGFDEQLTGSNKYSVYTRSDPFPRVMIAMDKIENPDEWETCYSFYAFDIPVPGTVTYNVQHCLRSIYSANEVVPRHRMTRADPRLPWEFRQVIYVFPADLYDCTFSQTPPTHF